MVALTVYYAVGMDTGLLTNRAKRRAAKRRPMAEVTKIAVYPYLVTIQPPTIAPAASARVTNSWYMAE
jgi:hypothetical protein